MDGKHHINSREEDRQMNKRIISLGFAAALFWSTAVVFAQEQAPAPSFKEGDTWQFNISRKGQVGMTRDQTQGTYELSVAQGGIKIYAVNGSQKTEMPIQVSGPSQELLRLVGKSDQQPDLKFPLSVGQKWTYEYEYRDAGQVRDQRRSAEVNVAGTEQMTTPAGAFQAYKLVKSEHWSTSGTSRSKGGGSTNNGTTTYFYSPVTKSIVKSSNVNEKNTKTVEIELINFTPGN